MKKVTTQVTITSYTNQQNENAIIQSVITYLNHVNNMYISYVKISDIQIALTEAINNAFTFAYLNKQGKISVTISIYDNKVLKLKIHDYGCGIEDVDKARRPFFSTKIEHSGNGFMIMEKHSEKLTVKSTLGKGTIVTMEFKL